MAFNTTTRPMLRARVLSRLPATLTATGGFQVVKTNGIWTISPDFGDLTTVGSITDSSILYTWVYNSTTESYSRISFSTLIGAISQVGSGYAIVWTFDTTTTDSDPGAGKIRLNNSTQSSATAAYVDLLDANGMDWTTVIDSFDDSTNTIKGQWTLTKVGDATKRLAGTLTAWTTAAGYRKLTIAVTASSASAPFANGDSVLFSFVRTGDTGTMLATDAGELTIASGAVTRTGSYHTIDTEADAASDDLDTINGGSDGVVLTIRAENSGRTVNVRNGVGNIQANGTMVLDHVYDTLTLVYDAELSIWLEIARSNNAA